MSALKDPVAPAARSFFLFSGDAVVARTDLQFQEFGAYVRRALAYRGFVEATRPEDAQIAVFLTYGIGAPVVMQYTESYPVYGMVSSGGTSSVSATTYGTAGNWNRTTGTIDQPSQYGVVGVGTQTETTTTYSRSLHVSAIDVARSRETGYPVEVWTVTAASAGYSGDLRFVFPMMVAATVDFMGQDTGVSRKIIVTDPGPHMDVVRGYYSKR